MPVLLAEPWVCATGMADKGLPLPFPLIYWRVMLVTTTPNRRLSTLAVACAAMSRTHLLLLSDSSACVGWFTGLRLPPTPHQAQLLLSAAILHTLSGIEVTVRWVPGPMNLADPWSRSTPTG